MANAPSLDDETQGRVELARRIGMWLRKTGVTHSEMAVDFADLVAAARSVERALAELVTLDAENPQQADVALALAGKMAAQLFTELRGHLDSLEKDWEQFEDRLEALAPAEE
jgi:hypothetical protein